MSADPATTIPPRPAVPARARVLAAQLAALFEQDQQLVVRLGGAQRLLAGVSDRLRDPAADRLAVGEQVHRAFSVYEQAAEQRRQLAVDVGELTGQLIDTLAAAGHPPEHARSANVHQLAAGTWQPTQEHPQ